MKSILYRLGAVAVVTLICLAIARLILPHVLRGADDNKAALIFLLLVGTSPFLALLALEFVLGRAFGFGFSMISRDENPDKYWSWIRFRILTVLVVIGAAYYQYFRRRH